MWCKVGCECGLRLSVVEGCVMRVVRCGVRAV